MERRIAVVVLALSLLLAGALPASAASDWDPDDVEGPLDLRWLGAWFVPDDHIRITVSFYDGFRLSALSHGRDVEHGLRVRLTGSIAGVFQRRHGRIVFFYGDFASGCGAAFPKACWRARVTRPSANILKVRFRVVRDPPNPTYEVQAFTALMRHGDVVRDTTGTLDLGMPPDA
jgi:hypothetical protein